MVKQQGDKGSGRGQAALNLIMRGVLNVPLLHRAVSNRVLVIDVIGRTSGRLYRIPVGYTPVQGALLIGTVGRWRRNLESGMTVDALVAGRWRRLRVETITDEARCAQLYREILAFNPVHGRYAKIRRDPDGSANRADLRAAIARGIGVVRLSEPDGTHAEVRLGHAGAWSPDR